MDALRCVHFFRCISHFRRMVIPLGTQFMTQYLMLVEKQRDGSVTNRQILPVRFVPLTGGH